jgi:hypothetical protein
LPHRPRQGKLYNTIGGLSEKNRLEYPAIAVNKAHEAQAGNTVMAVL